MKNHQVVSTSVSPRIARKIRKVSKSSGISVSGIVRLVIEDFMKDYSNIKSNGPYAKRKRVISDVTIRIQKGIKVRIV